MPAWLKPKTDKRPFFGIKSHFWLFKAIDFGEMTLIRPIGGFYWFQFIWKVAGEGWMVVSDQHQLRHKRDACARLGFTCFKGCW
ncbi:MAG: hypothetical protein UZ12_BCD005002154 [Bacteroidetes bacterium OLB12]|nr:MAG: hypothetical protein UZ12_BCD005002154 [Bacteroidetes bacterium OLB12]